MHRTHEALLISVPVGSPDSVPVEYGLTVRTGRCNGHQGIYRNDVPEGR